MSKSTTIAAVLGLSVGVATSSTLFLVGWADGFADQRYMSSEQLAEFVTTYDLELTPSYNLQDAIWQLKEMTSPPTLPGGEIGAMLREDNALNLLLEQKIQLAQLRAAQALEDAQSEVEEIADDAEGLVGRAWNGTKGAVSGAVTGTINGVSSAASATASTVSGLTSDAVGMFSDATSESECEDYSAIIQSISEDEGVQSAILQLCKNFKN